MVVEPHQVSARWSFRSSEHFRAFVPAAARSFFSFSVSFQRLPFGL